MEDLIDILSRTRSVVFRIAEIGVGLIGIIVVSYLLLGEGAGAYVNSVVQNLAVIVSILKPETVVAVAVLVVGYYILRRYR